MWKSVLFTCVLIHLRLWYCHHRYYYHHLHHCCFRHRSTKIRCYCFHQNNCLNCFWLAKNMNCLVQVLYKLNYYCLIPSDRNFQQTKTFLRSNYCLSKIRWLYLNRRCKCCLKASNNGCCFLNIQKYQQMKNPNIVWLFRCCMTLMYLFLAVNRLGCKYCRKNLIV